MENVFKQSPKIKFIPCVKWVRRGVAKPNPEKVELTKQELAQVIAQTKSKLRVTTESDGAGPSRNDDEFDLDNYDEDGDVVMNINDVATIENDDDEDSDSDSEKEDDIIKPDDNLVLVANVEDTASVLEVYVYNESEGSLYVHHDFLLPSIPLCLEWLNYEPGESDRSNLCAVGSMSPVIEVWDLDIVNCLEPAFTLGRQSSRRKKITQIGHKDAVLDLAWNSKFHHILASASVDKTVMLWDLDEGKPHTTFKDFSDKVQCVRWHLHETQTLLAGGCDKTAKVFDCRSDSANNSWKLNGEVEKLVWDPMAPSCFTCGTNTGSLEYFDCRKGSLWSIEAHEQDVTGIVLSDRCPGFMVTTGGEGELKVWDYKLGQVPQLVLSKAMGMGLLHCLELSPDSVFTIATGGDNKEKHFSVFNLTAFEAVQNKFSSRELIKVMKEEDESD